MIVIKKIYRWLIYAIMALLALFIICMAIVRFAIFPNINHYKQDIAAKISEKIGLEVQIGQIITGWDGISPQMLIRDIDVFDDQNVSALHLNNVKGTLSWLSIPLLHAHLSEISLKDTKLTIQRRKDGAIYVAGIAITGEGKPDFANWVLKQSEVNVNNTSIVWQDELRQAPPLSLDKVNFKLSNPPIRKLIGQHLFSASAIPSTGTKKRVYVNGNFFGNDISKIHELYGKAYLRINDTDLTAWKPWIDYPMQVISGSGNLKLWLSFSKNKITEVESELKLADLSIGKLNTEKLFNANLLSGKMIYSDNNNIQKFNAQNVTLVTIEALNIDHGQASFTHSIRNKKPWIDASVKLKSFDLAAIKQIQAYDIVPVAVTQDLYPVIDGLSPNGNLRDIHLSWEGETKNPRRYEVASQFNNLSINAYKSIPGFKNLTGEINANQDLGTLTLETNNASLDFKKVLRWPIPVNTLDGKITWRHYDDDKIKISTRDLAISNTHLQGDVDATYDYNHIKGGYLDVSGKFNKGNIEYASFYFPTTLNNKTLNWLDSSIKSGKADDIKLTIKGNLADFPYITKNNKLNKNLGLFRVTANINDALLAYGKSWPTIEGLGLGLLFEGARMELNANKGSMLGNKITQCKVTIDNLLDIGAQVLNIEGNTEGNVEEAIKFVNQSPVKGVALGFTDNLQTAGTGKLSINVTIPLHHVDDSKYKGVYNVNNGGIITDASIGIPEINKINGALSFSENGLDIQNMTGEILGGPATFNLATEAGGVIYVTANGAVSDAGIQSFIDNPLTDHVDGNAKWTGQFTIAKPLVNFKISSNLVGLAIDLPTPLAKTAEQTAVFNIEKTQSVESEDKLKIQYNEVVSTEILREEKNGKLTFSRGDIGLNTPAKLTDENGLTLHGQLDYVNADDWLALFDKGNQGEIKPVKSKPAFSVKKAYLKVNKLDIFNRSINALQVTASPLSSGLDMDIQSQEINGSVEWQNATEVSQSGKIIARLKNLVIPESNTKEDQADEPIKRQSSHYPGLDVVTENFVLGKKQLGRLELNAFESNNSWAIQKLLLSSADYALNADGVWHNWTQIPNTFLNFTLESNDIEKTLQHFGQADVVKGGRSNIVGQLQWPGSPHDFKTNGLNGSFILDAKKGQISKVKPGVGRLLGLLSLQSLPRRLTLDFRDLFSEGFAFDSINASAKIANGVMSSDDFFMTGPAAEVEIKGQTDLLKETQNFKVKVVPHISDSLSLAALAGGPIAGVAAFVAQKILKDPLNKIVQTEYVITGTWDNPQEVESKNQPKDEESLIN